MVLDCLIPDFPLFGSASLGGALGANGFGVAVDGVGGGFGREMVDIGVGTKMVLLNL